MTENPSARDASGRRLSRRSVLGALGAAGGAAIGLGGVAGTAAGEGHTVAFCGCGQVAVTGASPMDGPYRALVYCHDDDGGRLGYAPLSGDDGVRRYEGHEGCKVVGVVGPFDAATDPDQRRVAVCNEHGPHRCADRALAAATAGTGPVPDLVEAAETDGENTLTVVGTGGTRVRYFLEVTGSLREDPDAAGGDGLEDADVIDGTRAVGIVAVGADTYRYRGHLESFMFSMGTTAVLVNGHLVTLDCADPGDLGVSVRSGGCGRVGRGRRGDDEADEYGEADDEGDDDEVEGYEEAENGEADDDGEDDEAEEQGEEENGEADDDGDDDEAEEQGEEENGEADDGEDDEYGRGYGEADDDEDGEDVDGRENEGEESGNDDRDTNGGNGDGRGPGNGRGRGTDRGDDGAKGADPDPGDGDSAGKGRGRGNGGQSSGRGRGNGGQSSGRGRGNGGQSRGRGR